MSMITEQIKRLKDEADLVECTHDYTAKLLREASDTIEQLAAKVREDNVYQKAFEDIKAEIQDALNACVDIIDNTKRGVYPQIYSNDQMEGRKMTYEHCLEIISKHNPDKVGKEME